MAQLITVRLSRGDASPWGFRLQGGKDFGTPLVIQKVNGGSPAEKAGLIAGDSVVKVNSTDVFNLRHKDAQDVIVRAGQSFELTVQRGGSTWKPTVNPVGTLPRTQPIANNVTPVTKTSLAAKKQEFTPIGATHNLSPKGFNNTPPHVNGDGPKLVNKQYNSPMALYSEESIAETLSAQAEVLSTGALGVNFKKNEKNYNAAQSEVFKMLQEAEKEPKSPEPASTGVAGLRHVVAPETKPAPATPQLPPGQNICADCERLIVGVFVRIKDKNLHVECFKCATCGSSLKNVGYYNINQKLYCDIHAKLAARSNPPAPNMVPVTIPPGGKVPAASISAALASHSLPSPSPLSPSGNPMPAPFQTGTSLSGPKPFSSVQPSTPTHSPVVAPLSNTLPRSGSSTAMPGRFSGVKPTPAFRGGASGGASGRQSGAIGVAPKRGRGILNLASGPGCRVPLCGHCNSHIRGPFITALGKIWCPEHFVCTTPSCRRPLQDMGFVEERGQLYCEYCFEQYLAPNCSKCNAKIKGDCLNAIGKQFHPECFTCAYCSKLFGNSPFFLEDGLPYCEADWNELFTTKCFACGFPVEAGDRWVEALNNNYHSQCFNCTMCKKNLEGQSFFAKGGRPFCKNHAR